MYTNNVIETMEVCDNKVSIIESSLSDGSIAVDIEIAFSDGTSSLLLECIDAEKAYALFSQIRISCGIV